MEGRALSMRVARVESAAALFNDPPAVAAKGFREGQLDLSSSVLRGSREEQ